MKGKTIFLLWQILEDTTRYAGLVLAPAAKAFFGPLGKKEVIKLFWPIFGNSWCTVVTMVTFSSNLTNFKRIQKTKKNEGKKSKKIHQISKKFKNTQKNNNKK